MTYDVIFRIHGSGRDPKDRVLTIAAMTYQDMKQQLAGRTNVPVDSIRILQTRRLA